MLKAQRILKSSANMPFDNVVLAHDERHLRRKVIRLRKQDASARREEEAILATLRRHQPLQCQSRDCHTRRGEQVSGSKSGYFHAHQHTSPRRGLTARSVDLCITLETIGARRYLNSVTSYFTARPARTAAPDAAVNPPLAPPASM